MKQQSTIWGFLREAGEDVPVSEPSAAHVPGNDLDVMATPKEPDAAPVTAPGPETLSAVSNTHDRLRTLARDNRTVLKFLLQLYDFYRGDDKQLGSKEAVTAMTGILRSMAAQSTPDIAQYGHIDWEPDPISFIEFFDSMGDKSMAEFLGIQNMGDIPGADLEARADEIRNTAIKSKEDDASNKDDASKIVASTPKSRNLAERGHGNHVLSQYYPHKTRHLP